MQRDNKTARTGADRQEQSISLATAAIFAEALKEFGGAFSEIVFAVTDWSPVQRFIGPLQHVFAAAE